MNILRSLGGYLSRKYAPAQKEKEAEAAAEAQQACRTYVSVPQPEIDVCSPEYRTATMIAYEVAATLSRNTDLEPFLAFSNAWTTPRELLHALSMDLSMTGNAFIFVAKKNGRAYEIWRLPSRYMGVIPDERTLVGGFRYTCEPVVELFKPSEIIHAKTFSPTSIYCGAPMLLKTPEDPSYHTVVNLQLLILMGAFLKYIEADPKPRKRNQPPVAGR